MNKSISSYCNHVNNLIPSASAVIRGNNENPDITGYAIFYNAPIHGIYIQIEVYNLPDGFFGTHIHEFGNCTPPFNLTGSHYNPTSASHPEHSGDLPPTLSSGGYAWTLFYDGRLSIEEVINKSIIIHNNRDDFSTQPSGDSGDKIACGAIQYLGF